MPTQDIRQRVNQRPHGIGEVGITGVAAAIANAVYNATGVRVRELPITLDKVLAGATA